MIGYKPEERICRYCHRKFTTNTYGLAMVCPECDALVPTLKRRIKELEKKLSGKKSVVILYNNDLIKKIVIGSRNDTIKYIKSLDLEHTYTLQDAEIEHIKYIKY